MHAACVDVTAPADLGPPSSSRAAILDAPNPLCVPSELNVYINVVLWNPTDSGPAPDARIPRPVSGFYRARFRRVNPGTDRI